MAGICGKIGKEANVKEMGKMLGNMQNTLRHRGPNIALTRVSPTGEVAIGCLEMETSDRATSAFNKEKELMVLLDGNLLNFNSALNNVKSLTKCYKKYKRQGDGKKCLSELDGSFALVIIDGEETILARDPLGVRSLVYGTDENENLYFASEAKALIGHIPNVSVLPPGHYYSTKEGLKPYQAFTPKVDFDPENLEETLKVVKETVIEATEKRVRDGAVGGVALSGGLDSSIITAILVKHLGIKLPQFTASVKSAVGPDLYYSKLVADYFGLGQYYYLKDITDQEIIDIIPWAIWYLESIDQDCVSGWIANFYVALKAAAFTQCTLVGETADEVSGGYFGELEDFYEQWQDPDRRQAVYQHLIDIACDTGLKRMNQGWHAASVVPRAPFADLKLLEVFKKIPMKWKYNEDCNRNKEVPEVPEKWILRKAFEPDLPPEIAWRKKMRFARGVGVDLLMDKLVAKILNQDEELKQKIQELNSHTPLTGMKLASTKERYYYYFFTQQFPYSFENLTVRWDPFI